MSFEPFRELTSHTVVLSQNNIDTDQIIPARFLTTTSREGLGQSAFYDWRYNNEGQLRNDSPLDHLDMARHEILVAGANFGCGSSREHAPWALLDFGFKAVISSDIADIFKSNSLKNGLLPVVVDQQTHQDLLGAPGTKISINLENLTVKFSLNGGEPRETNFEIEAFARQCLLKGVDPLGAILTQMPAIEKFEEAHG